MLIPLRDINRLPPKEVAIIATGAQGESRSILGRLATGRHTSIRITQGDTVVLSSHTIPGNEETVNRVINRLFQRGANVVYHPVAPVHVSGHASQEEQKTLLSIIRPKFFVPIHGELRHLNLHASLAKEVGVPQENIAIVENGYVLTFTKDSMEIGERVPGGYVYVDGAWVGDAISPQVIKRRDDLAVSGVCSVAFVYDRQRGNLVGRPRIIGRAVASHEVFQDLVPDAEDVLRSVLKETKSGTSISEVEVQVQKALSNYFYKKAKNRPEIIVTSIPAG
jgi:ribonuclease J